MEQNQDKTYNMVIDLFSNINKIFKIQIKTMITINNNNLEKSKKMDDHNKIQIYIHI